MKLPSFTKSLRFRLTGMTSVVMFGGTLLMLTSFYVVLVGLARRLTDEVKVVTAAGVDASGQVVFEFDSFQFRTMESLFIEQILKEVTARAVVVLLAIFALSLLVGWLLAGRALKPVDELTQVATDIEANDLGRRIEYEGPDDELARMAQTFDSMLDRLDLAFRDQRTSLAETSHDLRTPLAVIRSNLEVAMSDHSTSADEWRETGTIALRAAERMSNMVDGLLAASRLEISAPTFMTFDLQDVVATAVEDFDVGATGAVVSNAGSSAAPVLGDRASVGRAVWNLIDNASRFTPDGEAVSLSSGVLDGWAFLVVADRGPGVSAATVRGEATRRGGLGLQIVREVMRLHGGEVDASPRTGGGTVIALWFPRDGHSARPVMSALPAI